MGDRIKFFTNSSYLFCKKSNYDRNHIFIKYIISNNILKHFTKIIPELVRKNDNWLFIIKYCFDKGNLRKDGHRALILIFIFLKLSFIFKLKSLNHNKFITTEILITRINLKLNNYF